MNGIPLDIAARYAAITEAGPHPDRDDLCVCVREQISLACTVHGHFIDAEPEAAA